MGKHKTMKKGEAKALSITHPNSRKAKSLAKKILKGTRRQKTKTESMIKRTLLVSDKFLWFKENLEPCEVYTAPMLSKLFQKYLARFDDELEQIRLKHSIGQRKGRQHASREDIIVMTQKRESEEYNGCGIEMVDILNPKQLKQFKVWEGNPGVQLKIKRFSKSFLENYKQPNMGKSETPSNLEENKDIVPTADGEDMVVEVN